MNENAFIAVSYFLYVSFIISLIFAVFVIRSLLRTKKAARLRQQANTDSSSFDKTRGRPLQ